MNEIYYIHGSKSSLDLDVMVVVSGVLTWDKQELHEICHKFEVELEKSFHKKVNVNLISIDKGVVYWCFKGTVDEVNNSLIYTYHLHPQKYDLLIRKRLPRDFELKAIRAVRVILSFLSRTEHREAVKSALKGDIYHKLKVLDYIDLSTITDLGSKSADFKDYLKVVAFQIGQVLGLYMNDEFYTKESISESLPALSPFLFREDYPDLSVLENFKSLLVTSLSKREWKRLNE